MLKLLRCEKGTGLVEFAIVLPLLATLVIGIIETGRFAAFSVRISNAARAGAQFAQSQGERTAYDTTDIANAACADAGFTCSSTASPNTMVVTVTNFCTYSDGTSDPACDPPAQGSGLQRLMYATVTASATFNPLLNYPLFPNSEQLSASTTMQVDQGQ